MTFKQRLSPILRFIKSAAILFIPFSWWMGMSSKVNQLGSDNEQELENRRPDNYKRSDVDNELRGGIRFFAINLALTPGSVALAMLVTPYVSPLLAAILPIVIGLGILPNFADFLAKQAIRAVSWIKNKDNAEVLNPTYPGKYNHHRYPEVSTGHLEADNQIKEVNTSTGAIMKALYQKKKEIKNNPEGWWGLSDLQQEQCAAINLAVKHFRQHPNWSGLSSDNQLDNQSLQQKRAGHRRNPGWFTKEYNFNPAMQQFLTETINPSYGK